MFSIDVFKANNEYAQLESPTAAILYDTAEEAVAAIPDLDDDDSPDGLALSEEQRQELLKFGCIELSDQIWTVTQISAPLGDTTRLSDHDRSHAAMAVLENDTDYTDDLTDLSQGFSDPQYMLRGVLFAMLQQAGGVAKIELKFDAEGFLDGYFLQLSEETSVVESPLIYAQPARKDITPEAELVSAA